MTYRFFLACLKIAREILETTKTYYKSKKAKLDYLAALEESKKFDQKDFEKYIDRRIELEITDKIEQIMQNIPVNNGKSEVELKSQLVMATKSLIKEL